MRQQTQRLYPRVKATGRVFIHDQEHIFIAPINNVSRGGIFVDKLVALEVGHQVKVIIKSDDFSSPLQASGKIIRVENDKRQGSAIQFDWIDINTFSEIPAE